VVIDGRAGSWTTIPAASRPVVVDPTGAGDSLAGGFLGACARRQRHPLDMLDEALDAGLRSAAAAITAFGPDGLRRANGGGLLPAV
jgi:sugar/nucleoside kinase (ribokinase family)